MTPVADYDRAGYVAPLRVLTEAAAEQVRDRFDRLEAVLGAAALENAHREAGGDLFQLEDAFRIVGAVAASPMVLDVLSEILGPNIMLVNTTRFFCRYGPDPDKHTAWHQDSTYLGLEPPEIVTVWYAIDNVDENNGCLRFVSGSHTSGIREHHESVTPGNILNKNQEVLLTSSDERALVSVPLRSGDACIFPGTLLHSAGRNTSSRRRAALACRFINPATRSTRPFVTSGLMLRGIDRHGHYAALDLPIVGQ